MTKINFQKLGRYYPVHHEILHEYDLNPRQALIFGYLFNHCQQLKNNGYCGYSNERIAKDLNMPKDTFKTELGVLKRKELIVIDNSRRFTKVPGKSRVIYIKSQPFLQEEQMSLTDIELDNAKKKIEKLESQIIELNAELHETKKYGNAFTIRIERSGVIPKSEIQNMHRILAVVYEAMSNEYTYDQIASHIDYMINQIKHRDVKKPISYLMKAADEYKSKPDRSGLVGTIFDFKSSNDDEELF